MCIVIQAQVPEFLVVISQSQVQAKSRTEDRHATRPNTTSWTLKFSDFCQMVGNLIAQLDGVARMCFSPRLFHYWYHLQFLDTLLQCPRIPIDLMATSWPVCPASGSDRFSPLCSAVESTDVTRHFGGEATSLGFICARKG